MYSLRSSAQRLPSGIYSHFKTPLLQNANDLTSHENMKEGYLFGRQHLFSKAGTVKCDPKVWTLSLGEVADDTPRCQVPAQAAHSQAPAVFVSSEQSTPLEKSSGKCICFLTCSAPPASNPGISSDKSTCACAIPSSCRLPKGFCALLKELATPKEILYRCTQTSRTSHLTALLLLLFVQGQM